ncbi:hypothetical protein DFO60_4945, partial [Ectopseudomonas oleovorans]
DCSAAAGWRADPRVVLAKEAFGLRYNSDCRGRSLFVPRLESGALGTPQIPVDMPTFDEVVGPDLPAADWNSYLLKRFRPGALNVYTLHAEVEGIAFANDFRALLNAAREQEIHFIPMGDRLPEDPHRLPEGKVVRGSLAGRQGWLGVQQ